MQCRHPWRCDAPSTYTSCNAGILTISNTHSYIVDICHAYLEITSDFLLHKVVLDVMRSLLSASLTTWGSYKRESAVIHTRQSQFTAALTGLSSPKVAPGGQTRVANHVTRRRRWEMETPRNCNANMKPLRNLFPKILLVFFL